MSEQLAVTEIYASIQGESSHAGRPCTFVRLAGCPLRCRWCDTKYSFAKGEQQTIAQIVSRVQELGLPLCEVTGGEPLAQPSSAALLTALCDAGVEVLLETSGAFALVGLDARVKVIADLKCPGSDEDTRNLWPDLARLRPCDELKIVVADRRDFDWALAALRSQLVGTQAQILWSAVAGELPPAQLAAWLLQERAPGRLQLQFHKILWPDANRGV